MGNICFIIVSTSNYEGSCSEHMVADFFHGKLVDDYYLFLGNVDLMVIE